MSCAVCGTNLTDQVVCWACCPWRGGDEDTADLITAEDLLWTEAESETEPTETKEKAA